MNLFNLFDRGWYYHRKREKSPYINEDFIYSEEITMQSMEVELLDNIFIKKYLNKEFPPCYLVLLLEKGKWKCFIDFHSESRYELELYYTIWRKEHGYFTIQELPIGNYCKADYEKAQIEALKLLTDFIISHR